MRTLILTISLFVNIFLFSQNSTGNWINRIDTSLYTLRYRAIDIPIDFYTIIGINGLKEIANANDSFERGCTGSLPHKRINWIANDSNNHWILSVSYGGRGSGTEYYFIDKVRSNLNVNQLYFYGPDSETLTLSLIAIRIRAKQFDRGFINLKH
jgi:hypothetical protein